MQIGGLDLYVNHPVMAVGATDWVPFDLALDGRPAAACPTHVLVRVQPQTALIHVRLFTGNEDVTDPAFTTVFDGTLLLPDGRLVIGDVIGETRFVTTLLGMPGTRGIRVSVDDTHGFARNVDIRFAESVS